VTVLGLCMCACCMVWLQRLIQLYRVCEQNCRVHMSLMFS